MQALARRHGPAPQAFRVVPIVGAFFVNGAKSWFTMAFPEYWLFFLGLLFIGVTLFMPDGVVGLLGKIRNRFNARRAPAAVEKAA